MASEDQGDKSTTSGISSYLDWLGINEPVARRQFMTRIGKSLFAVGAVGALPTILAACSSSATASPGASTSAGGAAPSVAAPRAAASSTGAAAAKTYRVAFIIWINNPYWQETADQVNKLLKPRLAAQGVKVDLVNASASATAVDMSAAIDSAVAQQYDGIIVAGVAPSMDPAIKRATDKGIPVFTFCCDVPTSTRQAFYGPDNYTIGKDAATLMAQGLQKENILQKRGLSTGVIGIGVAVGVSSLVDRANGFRDNWAKIGPKNVTILQNFDNKDDAKLVYSTARDAISSYPNLVGLYDASGSQYMLGQAIIDANKVGQVIGIAHEVFQPTLQVMLKNGLWGVTNDAPIGQVIPPGDAMVKILKTGQKPAQEINIDAGPDTVNKYWVYSSDTQWINEELQHWNELFNDCTDGCPALVSSEMKGM